MFLKKKRIIQKAKQAMNLEDNQKGQKKVRVGSIIVWNKLKDRGDIILWASVPEKLSEQGYSTKLIFPVPIGSAKKSEVTEFHLHAYGINIFKRMNPFAY